MTEGRMLKAFVRSSMDIEHADDAKNVTRHVIFKGDLMLEDDVEK